MLSKQTVKEKNVALKSQLKGRKSGIHFHSFQMTKKSC